MESRNQNMFKIIFCQGAVVGEILLHLRDPEFLTPYPAGHRSRVKGDIVQSARHLFKRHGFDNDEPGAACMAIALKLGGWDKQTKSRVPAPQGPNRRKLSS
jgi:hypothetical protein